MYHETFAGSHALHIPEDHRVSVNVNNLGVSIKSKDAETGCTSILQNVSFELGTCNMMAIMGGSGAGKTTLLNVLAQRLNINHTTMQFSGSVDYTVTQGLSDRVTTAYMQQQDVFLPGLTLFETLDYQAQLRLADTSKTERTELVRSLLLLLELDHRSNEIVKSFTGGINLSGGEQRRASLAIQLLSKPQLLFLDEPTTGLDTSSALKLVTVLRKLASLEIGITIILLIHQPRGEIVELFDKLCVLARGGRLIFYGPLCESVSYLDDLEKKGIVPTVFRSDDAFTTLNTLMTMSVRNTISAEKEEESTRIVDSMVSEWSHKCSMEQKLSPEEQKAQFTKNLKVFKPKNPLPFHRQIMVLTKRTFLLSLRDRASLLALNGGATFLGLVLGWMFYQPVPDLSGIRSLTSTLYTMLEVIGFSPLAMDLERLWAHDGVFFFKEYQEQCVTIPGFIISRRLAKFVTEELPMSILFAIPTYFMWGLRLGDTYEDRNDGTYFAIYLAITIIVAVLSTTTAMLCFTLGNDFATSTLIGNVFYQLQNSGCGYFVNAKTMPVYVRWVKYIAYFWYAFGALTANQFTDWEGKCPYPQSDDRCIQYSGNYQLSILGFPEGWIGPAIGYLCAWVVGFNVLTWLVLRFRNYDVSVAKKKKNTIGGDSDVDLKTALFSASSSDEKQEGCASSVTIDVKDVTLSVKVKESHGLFASKISRTLLNNISARFQENAVNAIMGPSGGGKTTFLNYLASRLPKSSSFSSNGKIFLNNTQEVSPDDISRIAAYVTQHDNILIPYLTVRETLYYQARLRLPEKEHSSIPGYISHLLRQTGLSDCADTPIGSNRVKGISGGEKRRVSIAIQLLSRPKVLFLDEPTSGLDIATSASIMLLLRDLAQAGTTVISTIHQPSNEIFRQFDSLTLLARGGLVVYNGLVAEIGRHFTNLGHTCPPTVSMADFALDLVSLKLDESKENFQSRVDFLISSWEKARADAPEYPCGLPIDMDRLSGTSVGFVTACRAVVSRQFKVSYRATDVMISRATQAIFLAIVYALFFAPLKNSQEGISNRLGLTQNVINLFFCGLVNNLALYPQERDIFHQEYKDGTYGVSVFSLAYFLVELPFEILPSIFFSALVVFGIGLPRTPGMFFAILFSSFVSVNVGESLGIIFNSLMTHLGLITNVLINLFVLAIFMAGTMSLQMPKFFKAWNYINTVKYIVQICVNMGFRGQIFTCPSGECVLLTGEDVLDMYGMNAHLGGAFGGLVTCLVAYRAIAVMAAYCRAKWFV